MTNLAAVKFSKRLAITTPTQRASFSPDPSSGHWAPRFVMGRTLVRSEQDGLPRMGGSTTMKAVPRYFGANCS